MLTPVSTKLDAAYSGIRHSDDYAECGIAGTRTVLLDETGAPMKVQQELMRHANIQTTMNVYGSAILESKRAASSKIVRMVLMPSFPYCSPVIWGDVLVTS